MLQAPAPLYHVTNVTKELNGYNYKQKALVEDAKTETVRKKDTQELKVKDWKNGEKDNFDVIEKDFAVINYRRKSLVEDAKTDTARNKEAQENWIKELKKDGTENFDLTEEEVLILSQLPSNESSDKNVTTVIFSTQDGLSSLPDILKCIERCNGSIQHLETRPSRNQKLCFEILLKLVIQKADLLILIQTVRQTDNASVNIVANEKLYFKETWFPKHISDLDFCNHILSKFEPDLDKSHPGYRDCVYRARRKEIAELAFDYKYGQPIPKVHYTDEETKTWGTVFKQLRNLNRKHACSSFQKVFSLLEQECGYKPDNIPQLQDVSNFIKRRSGFTLRPAAGLLSARDFLSSLAFRVFQCTQYVRHSSSPNHSPEPDCIHELLGHIPMFADPHFAKFSQEIGLASLGASDEEIEKLATVYWFTVEFGLCKENGQIKAYGAGLLSSYGELLHALSDKPNLIPFNPETTALQPYQDQEYQDTYFVAESFQDAQDKVRKYVQEHMTRRYDFMYDPFTESVVEVDSLQKIENLTELMRSEVVVLCNAIRRLKCYEFSEFK